MDDVNTPVNNQYIIQNTITLMKPLAKSLPRLSLLQMKLLFIMFEHIDWRKKATQIVIIDNQIAKARLGRKDKNNTTFAGMLRKEFISMMEDSDITVKHGRSSQAPVVSGKLIIGVIGNTDYTAVAINPLFMPYISKANRVVGRNMRRDYVQFLMEDIMNFRSKNSLNLYLTLRTRQKYDRTIPIPYNAVSTEVRFKTNPLKEIFGLEYSDFTEKVDGKVQFNRASFERKVLIPALAEVNQSRLIEIIPPADDSNGIHGDLFRKTKFNNHILYYYIKFITNEHVFIDTDAQYCDEQKLIDIADAFQLSFGVKAKYKQWLDKLLSIDEVENQKYI